MPTNSRIVEVVRFEESGLKEIDQKVRDFANHCEDATRKGAKLAEHWKTLRTAALGVYGGVTALGVGLARAGMQGSVEGMRLEYAWTRLSRQLASVAIPVVDKLTAAIGRVASWFEKLSGPQQDFISKIGMIAVVAGPAIWAMKRLLGVTSALFALGRAGLGLGAASTATAVATAGATAGVAGLAGAAGGRMGAGAMAPAAGLTAGEAALAGGGLGLAARAKGAAKFAGKALLAGEFVREGADAAGLTGSDSFYDVERRRGTSRLGSAFAAVGHSALNLLSFGYHADRLREKGEMFTDEQMAAGKQRREIAAMGFASEEAGGAHLRIQEELLKVSAAKAEENTQSLGLLTNAIEALSKQLEAAGYGGGGGGGGGGVMGLGGAIVSYADQIHRLAAAGRE